MARPWMCEPSEVKVFTDNHLIHATNTETDGVPMSSDLSGMERCATRDEQ
jgi:hypothetical protein